MMIRTQVLFPRDLLSELQLIAREYGWSVSETVRKFVAEKVKKQKAKRKNAIEGLLELARWAEKHHVKAPRDISTNDDYLYGKYTDDYKRIFGRKRKTK